MKKEACFLLGTLIKVHGYQGHIQLKLRPDYPDNVDELESIFIEIDGILVPFFLTSIMPHSDDVYLLGIEGIDSREEAIYFISSRVYIHSGEGFKTPDIQNPSRLLHFSVINETEEMMGKITGFQDIPGNPIFIVKRSDTEFMIPYHPDLILSIDLKKMLVKMRIPQGLADGF